MYTDLDEQELARRCSQGDRLAEGELYRRYAARVYTLCRRYLGDDEEAKDLMQESLIQALDKIQTFNGSKGSLYGWISRIAINKALNQIKRKRWRTVSLDAWTQDTIPAMADRLSGCMDTGYHPGTDRSGDGDDSGGEAAGMDIQAAGFEKGRLQSVLYRWILTHGDRQNAGDQ